MGDTSVRGRLSSFRRLGAAAALFSIGVVVYGSVRRRPHQLELELVYGPLRRQLQHVRVRVVRSGERWHTADFDYRRQSAPARQRYKLRLSRGRYRVVAELEYRGPNGVRAHASQQWSINANDGEQHTLYVRVPPH